MHAIRPHRLATAAALTLALVWSNLAQAQLVNGDFNSGLTGWTTLGNASVQPGTLLLDNSGIAADTGLLASAAGLSSASVLDLNDTYAYEGSLAYQSFSAITGQHLSFSWGFGSDETDLSPQLQDYAFVVLDGQFTRLGGVGDAPALAQTFSFWGLTAGRHQLAFGVVDLGDYTVDSRLAVANVQLTSAVPEPGWFTLMLAGLSALGLCALRLGRRQRHAGATA